MPSPLPPLNPALLERRTYTVKEVATLFGMSQQWVIDQASTGRLASFRLGGRVLFPREAIDELAPPRGERTALARNKPRASVDDA